MKEKLEYYFLEEKRPNDGGFAGTFQYNPLDNSIKEGLLADRMGGGIFEGIMNNNQIKISLIHKVYSENGKKVEFNLKKDEDYWNGSYGLNDEKPRYEISIITQAVDKKTYNLLRGK
jgi:hypothetical protein